MEKLAVIDIGSNSARLVIYNILEGGYFVVADDIKETVRLGEDMERDGFLKASRIGQAIKTLKMFRKLCDAEGVEKIIAVGTNAIRRAKNQRGFIEEVYATTGIKLKVLSIDEEAFHIYQAIVNSFDIQKGLIVDISGSSFQLIQFSRRAIINFENLQFGAITLTNLFGSGDKLSPVMQAEAIEEFVVEQLKRVPWLKDIDPDLPIIGVGGSFRNLGRIARRLTKYPLEMTHNYQLSIPTFETVYDSIKILDADKRVKIKGLSFDRADIITSAFAAMKALFTTGRFHNLFISGIGLREGMVISSIPSLSERPLNDVLGYSMYTMMNYFGENFAHAEHVHNLSMQLFKQLRVLHKLHRQYIKVLRVAALMHDVGTKISYYEHHKHSFYMILNSNLCGLSHRELVLASFVASQHMRDEFSLTEWGKYKGIVNDEDLNAVLKLGIILRIAESLDRSMSGAIKSLNCDVLGDSVIMKTEGVGDYTLEIRNAMSCAPEFARAYKKNLEIL